MTIDHYITLGIERSATLSDITKAFRKLARRLHPDKNPSKCATDKFKQISAAYSVLNDDDKRLEYDNILNEREVEENGKYKKDSDYTNTNNKNDFYSKYESRFSKPSEQFNEKRYSKENTYRNNNFEETKFNMQNNKNNKNENLPSFSARYSNQPFASSQSFENRSKHNFEKAYRYMKERVHFTYNLFGESLFDQIHEQFESFNSPFFLNRHLHTHETDDTSRIFMDSRFNESRIKYDYWQHDTRTKSSNHTNTYFNSIHSNTKTDTFLNNTNNYRSVFSTIICDCKSNQSLSSSMDYIKCKCSLKMECNHCHRYFESRNLNQHENICRISDITYSNNIHYQSGNTNKRLHTRCRNNEPLRRKYNVFTYRSEYESTLPTFSARLTC